jgi:tripartite-type tricarboxylate transporter receptor subunit TctC
MTRAIFRCFLVAYALCCAAAAWGGGYPERPVRLIIPFPPGGASDFGGRLVAAGLTDIFGQQFVVDNRGGASGLIGTEIAVRSRPDGYTLLVGNVNTMATNPYIQPMKVDPLKVSPRSPRWRVSHRDRRPQQRGGEHAQGIPR